MSSTPPVTRLSSGVPGRCDVTFGKVPERSRHAPRIVCPPYCVSGCVTVTEFGLLGRGGVLFYGLMQCSPYEIKDKLLKALDGDNNVSLTRFTTFIESLRTALCAAVLAAFPETPVCCLAQNANVPCNPWPGDGSLERVLGLASFPRRVNRWSGERCVVEVPVLWLG